MESCGCAGLVGKGVGERVRRLGRAMWVWADMLFWEGHTIDGGVLEKGGRCPTFLLSLSISGLISFRSLFQCSFLFSSSRVFGYASLMVAFVLVSGANAEYLTFLVRGDPQLHPWFASFPAPTRSSQRCKSNLPTNVSFWLVYACFPLNAFQPAFIV